MTSPEAAATALQNAAVLWSTRGCSGAHVVRVACDALVAGLDSPALCQLAAVNYRDAEYDVPGLFQQALEELGLIFYDFGSPAAEEATVRALASEFLAGNLTPRELTSAVHARFGHHLEFADPLAVLDDEYDLLGYFEKTTEAELDAAVLAEARRLVGEN